MQGSWWQCIRPHAGPVHHGAWPDEARGACRGLHALFLRALDQALQAVVLVRIRLPLLGHPPQLRLQLRQARLQRGQPLRMAEAGVTAR